MNLKQTLGTFALALLASAYARAQKPYAQCIFPSDVKTWTPEQDKHAKFNRSRVKLRAKITETIPLKANPYQFTEGQVTVASVTAKMCGQTAAQGFDNFIGYNPTYWQYMEKYVNWGGADDEGIVVLPPAGAIDAAHMNGVKIFANLFFQSTMMGRSGSATMLEHNGDTYPQAEQLYKMAKYYGFDGYFINDESGGQNKSSWLPFVKAFYAAAEADGNNGMEIQWYNADNYPYDEMLATNKNTSHFLDYGNTTYDHSSHAGAAGCSRDDLYHKIYNGQECGLVGMLGYNAAIDGAFPRTGHVGSLALFCPESHTWKDNVEKLFFTKDACGEVAYKAMTATFENERKMWVNFAGDPSNTTSTTWRGLSGALVETSTISSLPFYTDFSVGNGKHRFVKGVKSYTRDWSHSGLQSYLPTWRWWIENGDGLAEAINWDDAYNVGNSFSISGKLTAGDHLMRLYKMQAAVPAGGGKLHLVFKTNGATPELKLSTSSSATSDVTIAATSTTTENGWTVAEYDLEQVAGKTIYMVGFNLKAEADKPDYSLLLGHLDIIPDGYAPAAVRLSNLKFENSLGETGGGLRVVWDWEDNDDLDHFDVYTKTADGKEELVGQTRDEAYYIWDIKRIGVENSIGVSIVPVMKDGSEGTRLTAKADYPTATAPVVKIKSGKNYLTVGETTTLTATGSFAPTECKWELPEGLEFAGSSKASDFTITVKGTKVGKHNVKVTLTNEIGSTQLERFACEVFEDNAISGVKNLARYAKIVTSTPVNSYNYDVSKLIDGEVAPSSSNEKYCATATEPYFTLDLGGLNTIYGFNLYDCKSNKDKSDNVSTYKIFVSTDNVTWKEVVSETEASEIDVKKDYIEPVLARYVKFQAYAERAITVRLWEFEVYGKDNYNITANAPQNLDIEAGESATLKVAYDFNGDNRASDFKCSVDADNNNVTIGDITEDKGNNMFLVPISTSKMVGSTNLTVTVKNGEAERVMKVLVTVDSKELVNMLKGKTMKVRYYDCDYADGAEYTEKDLAALTDGDTTTDAMADEEESRNHSYDTWAVYGDGTDINLSKVVVYLPNNNVGSDDSYNDGIANHDVSIRVSDDGQNWETVKTFENLGKVAKLEYVLPKYKTCKYIGVAFNVNLNFYPAIAEVEAYEQFAQSVQVETALSVSGWNVDIVAESKPASETTSGDVKDSWAFYTSAVQDQGALCDAQGNITTRDGGKFWIENLDGDNALKISKLYSYNTLTVDEPVSCDEVSFLILSSDEAWLNVLVDYEDGSNNGDSFKPQDWIGGSSAGDSDALFGIGRIKRDGTDQIDDSNNVRAFKYSVKTDSKKKVKQIRIMNTKYGSVPVVLAISKKSTGSTTGVDKVTVDESQASVGIYTIDGIKISKLQRGLNIVRQADGTVKKVMVK